MLAGNGFNIKPSGKSWGKAKPMLKNIYVSFVMDGTCATLDLVLCWSLQRNPLRGLIWSNPEPKSWWKSCKCTGWCLAWMRGGRRQVEVEGRCSRFWHTPPLKLVHQVVGGKIKEEMKSCWWYTQRYRYVCAGISVCGSGTTLRLKLVLLRVVGSQAGVSIISKNLVFYKCCSVAKSPV